MNHGTRAACAIAAAMVSTGCSTDPPAHRPFQEELSSVGDPEAVEVFVVPTPPDTLFADPAFDENGGFLLNAGVNVIHVNAAGVATPLFPPGDLGRYELDPTGRRYGAHTEGVFEVRDLANALLASYPRQRAEFGHFVPGGGDLIFLPRAGDNLERPTYSDARFFDLSGLVSEFPTPELILFRLTQSRFFYTTPTEVVAMDLEGVEVARIPISLIRMEVSADGTMGVGLIRQEGVVEVAHLDFDGGRVLGTHTLSDAVAHIAVSPNGRHAGVATQYGLYRFRDGQLSSEFDLSWEWTTSIDVSDDGLVGAGGQFSDHASQVMLTGPPGTEPWVQDEGTELFAFRPSVKFAPGATGFTVNLVSGMTMFSIEAR